MANRRGFLIGLLATGLCPQPSWADAGNPAFLAAAMEADGRFVLCGLRETGEIAFRLPLPARGHAAAAHPKRPEAVAFARRPGRFALVIDCAKGQEIARLQAPVGRHFYGHGAFAGGGRWLFTTENDFDAARGMIGIWDAEQDYVRVGEVPSGGIGPHDIRTMPGDDTLIVANGGIETHPETGRTKLNVPTMQPNLAHIALDGGILALAEPPADLHKNSLRHLDVRADGLVAAGCQWQGDVGALAPVLATWRPGAPLRLIGADQSMTQAMQGYVGSVAFSPDGDTIALTGPRGGVALLFSDQGDLTGDVRAPDICGVASGHHQLVFTTGSGLVLTNPPKSHALSWDNHLVRIGSG